MLKLPRHFVARSFDYGYASAQDDRGRGERTAQDGKEGSVRRSR